MTELLFQLKSIKNFLSYNFLFIQNFYFILKVYLKINWLGTTNCTLNSFIDRNPQDPIIRVLVVQFAFEKKRQLVWEYPYISFLIHLRKITFTITSSKVHTKILLKDEQQVINVQLFFLWLKKSKKIVSLLLGKILPLWISYQCIIRWFLR